MSLNLGANMLGQLCEEIEDLANGGKMSDVDPLLPKLQKLFDQTHAEFNQILVSERGIHSASAPQSTWGESPLPITSKPGRLPVSIR
jgi:hypothetical protein